MANGAEGTQTMHSTRRARRLTVAPLLRVVLAAAAAAAAVAVVRPRGVVPDDDDDDGGRRDECRRGGRRRRRPLCGDDLMHFMVYISAAYCRVRPSMKYKCEPRNVPSIHPYRSI
mmetsp:Transcript_33320/g.80587  ORF Transcript_33320/g.80587 Transcript_33320/m.80587 type:complete len:115 (-) Transcript_33320:134-478(-)